VDIICCRSTDEVAQQAFRLRYEIFATEMGYGLEGIDHENRTFRDEFDPYAQIYVALKNGEVISTARTVYSRDCDLLGMLPADLSAAWKIDTFLGQFPSALAVSTKFAISPHHRGSIAATLITSRMYGDMLDHGIEFVFSMCSPYLIEFYSQLGFRVYSPSYADDVGFTTPIVLVLRDWQHLQAVRSPLLKQLAKRNLCNGEHPSVCWFHDTYGEKLEAFVSSYDDAVLGKILASSAREDADDAAHVGIFQAMSPEEIKSITTLGKIFNVAAGQPIIQTGQQDDEMYIVVDGEILERRLDGELPSFRIGPGQVIGEVALLTGTIRSTDFIAATDAQLASLSRQSMARLMKVRPELAARMLFNLARLQSFKLIRANQDMVRLCLDLYYE
jgi:Cyclic nucleotide-binding domain/Acetyltransferase (GNAT) domain